MKPPQPFLLPIWVIGGVVMLRIFMLFGVISFIRDYPSDIELPISYIFFEFFWPLLLIIEFYVYWFIRHRIYNKQWVHIHVWIVLVCLGIFPIAVILYRKLYPITVDSLFEQDSFFSTLVQIQIYGFWLLVGIAHVFFIATIVKSFSKKQETIADEQAPGLLDEFTD